MQIDRVIETVLWANIMLAVACVVLMIFEAGLNAMGLRRAYRMRLNLVCAACAGLVLVPLVALLSKTFQLASGFNATDLLVSQYLKGNIAMPATEFISLLSLNTRVVEMLAKGSGATALVILSAFVIAATLRAGYVSLNIARICEIISKGKVLRDRPGVRILTSETISVPFSTRGLFRYYVVLPASLLGDRELLRISVGHELQHIRQRDVELEFFAALLSPLFVLNPAFWLISDRLRRLREYSCDAAVLNRALFEPRAYSLCLLNIAKAASTNRSGRGPTVFGVPLVGRSQIFSRSPKSGLARRISAIAHSVGRGEKYTPWQGLALAVTLAMTVQASALAFSKPSDWSHERIMLSTVANLERLNHINEFGQAPLLSAELVSQ